jgi:VanZ family protein
MNLKLIFYLYLIAILILAILPFGTPVIHLNNFNVHFRLDYIIHLVMYFPWIFLSVSGLKIRLVYAMLFGLIIGAGTETIQYFLSYRTFNINDLIANIIGIVLGLVLILPSVSRRLHKITRIS